MIGVAILGILLILSSPPQARSDGEKAKLELADAQFQKGQFEEAERSYERILSSWADSHEALIGLGRCLIALGRFNESVFPLAKARVQQPNDREAKHKLAQALVELNQFNQAEQLLKSTVDTDPDDHEAWFWVGVLRYRNGFYGSALQAFDQAHEPTRDNDTREQKLSAFRAICLAKTGHTQEAEATMNRLLANPLHQKDSDLVLVYAQLLYETKRPQAALDMIDHLLTTSPNLAMAHFWRAKVLFSLGRNDEAARDAQTAVQLLPQLPFPRYLLVKIYQVQGRSEDARQQAEWLRQYEDRKDRGQLR